MFLLYKLIKNIIIVLVCHFLFHVKYKNLNILDNYEKCLICPNHSRIFDPIFIYPKINNLYIVAKSELFKNKFMAKFLTFYHIIPIEREKNDRKGTKRILELLKQQNKIRLLIFPEGGVFKENYKYNKRVTKNGAVYLASKTNIPIIPVHITQRPHFFSKVVVTFGSPFIPNNNVLKDKSLLNQEASKLIHLIYKL